ncbi:AAA family ATPase [Dermabacter sp. HSID17554]|uniref:AAA family ATPase n=1 Tax=Dermabacter sp. HSID17554 TaxID=2419511 RepID=UPI0013874607|nr:AAA family ATPase [Dermabacter sp. HSID17554]
MLREVKIVGGACFGERPLTITDLKPASFFYGPNGSGKTTISRAFAGYGSLQLEPEWQADSEMMIRVYNRDFVDKVLGESKRIPGVFVLGENSVEAQKRLEEIESPGGELAQARDRYERAKTSHKKAEADQSDAKAEFKNAAWKKYRALVDEHTTLLPAFTGQRGVGNSKEMLVTRLLERGPLGESESLPKLEELLAEAKAVFDTDATARNQLAEIDEFRWDERDDTNLLERKIVGSSEASLSELVDQLGNEDWVQAGRQHLDNAHGLCPFCQQTAPKDLAKQLEEMFDHRYMEQLERLRCLATTHSSWVRSIGDTVEGWSEESSGYLDGAEFQKSFGTLKAINEANAKLLERKLRAPSELVKVSATSAPIGALNAVIREANTKIDAHNRLVQSQKAEKPVLAAKCWTYLADVLLREELQAYKKKSVGLQKGVDCTREKIAEASSAISDLNDEVRSLQRFVESSQPVIEEINQLLRRSGFTSFHIVSSAELTDGYMLARNGVALDERSLSEGERTFIAFLYFYFLLNGRDGSPLPGKILAVIDDPISSLDSDVLFMVSTLVRELINRALSKSDHVAQVIVLTHNVYFHKEVTQRRHNDAGSGRCYHLIRKSLTGPNVVESHPENPVSTEYERLWSEVRRAAQGEQMSIIGLENVLRRIIENYFRIAGGIWEEDLVQHLEPAERPVLRSLFNWINEGSHGVFENLHYSPSIITQQTYLEVFERIFDKSGHGAHYRMMMG